MNGQRVTVVVDDEHQSQIQLVVDDLRAQGLQVDRVMETLGMVTGTATGDLTALERVEGVAAVELERGDLGIAPPSYDVQGTGSGDLGGAPPTSDVRDARSDDQATGTGEPPESPLQGGPGDGC